jgi:two-component system cell cycle response regulator
MSDADDAERIARLEQDLNESRAREKALGDLLENKLNEVYIHYHISRTISALLDLREMLQQVFNIIQKSVPFERVSVYLLDEKLEKLELVFCNGLGVYGNLSLRVGEGTPGRILENGEHIHIHNLSMFYDTFDDFVHMPGEEKLSGSYIGIALKAHNTTIGIIGMDSSAAYGLSVDDMDFMAILSYQLAAGIEKSRLFEKIQQLSQHDGLTGLYNHRTFLEKLEQEINRQQRTKKTLSLMMLDIDHFKLLNDNFGHQGGDAVLKELAVIMLAQSRSHSIDICCRYGGDEFAIIMPELELQKAIVVAERLRKAVENHLFPLKDNKREGKVTISLGVASYKSGEELTTENLTKKADDALYDSKRNGRNQVSFSQ